MQTMWDDLLNLEDRFYQEGYDLGVQDGQRAGRAEGRHFGMLKSFEKFVELGQLRGRAEVLQAQVTQGLVDHHAKDDAPPKITRSTRTQRQIERLLELTNIETLQPENTEDAVADVDERLKEANSKATLIAKILGQDVVANAETKPTSINANEQLEDFQARTRFNSDAT